MIVDIETANDRIKTLEMALKIIEAGGWRNARLTEFARFARTGLINMDLVDLSNKERKKLGLPTRD